MRRDASDSSTSEIFMASRGKKDVSESNPATRLPLEVNDEDAFFYPSSSSYWSIEKKDGDDHTGDVPFWAARGKKDGEGHTDDVPFWAARGKKDDDQRTDEVPFWAARGKKDGDGRPEDVPFWAARGKKDDDGRTGDVPFWAARGKKDGEGRADDVPFWAARGKKSGEDRTDGAPFWAARGRRDDATFWASRGRKAVTPAIPADLKYAIYLHRGHKLAPLDVTHKFWAPRGKKGKLRVNWKFHFKTFNVTSS